MGEKPIESQVEKIAKECEEANADKWTITKIVKQLSQEQQTGIKHLRKRALEMLQQLDPKAASVYASFQRMEVRTSKQLLEGFDRGNIIKSLLKETSVPRGVAEKIGHDVEEKIKDLEIESISTPLIREMANVKLLEYGHENIRNEYARLGLPLFEVKKIVEERPYSNRAIMTEYSLLKVIPNRLARMHLANELYIAEVQDFCTKPIATSLEAEALETPKESVLGILEKANRMQKFFSWRPNIFALNAAVSVESGTKTAKDAAVLFAKASKAVFLSGKSVPAFNQLFLFEPDSFSKKRVERESLAASANAMLKAGSQEAFSAFENCVSLDSKYKLKLIQKERPKYFLNCKSAENRLVNGIALEGKGICTFIALNLVFLAHECRGNESAFFEGLEKKAKAAAQLDELKKKELAQRHYLKKQGIEATGLESVVAIDSLLMPARIVSGQEKASELLGLGEKTVAELSKSLPESFSVAELRNKIALNRFALENRKHFKPGARYVEESQELAKSKTLCKSYGFTAVAETRKELNELLEGNVKLVELREK